MHKIQYKLLALFQILLGLGIYFFLLSLFGAKGETDAYFFVDSIFLSLQLLQLLAVEQFMYFYHEEKAKGEEEGKQFYQFAFTLALLLGVLWLAVLLLFRSEIVSLFSWKLDPERRRLLLEMFLIMAWGNLFFLVNFIHLRLLNAEEHYSLPYILESLPNLFGCGVLMYMLWSGTRDLRWLVWSKSLGWIGAALLGSLFVWKKCQPFGLTLSHPIGWKFIQNSFTMRLGHNIHNFLFVPVTNNLLALLPSGQASLYFYANKIITSLSSLVLGPSFRVFQSRFSMAWAEKQPEKLKKLMKEYLKGTLPLFSLGAIVIYFSLPWILPILSTKISAERVATIGAVFLSLFIWNLVITIESVFVMVCIVAKDSLIFLKANSLFIFLYLISLVALHRLGLGLFSIPLGALTAQIFNFYLYFRKAKRLLQQLDQGGGEKSVPCSSQGTGH